MIRERLFPAPVIEPEGCYMPLSAQPEYIPDPLVTHLQADNERLRAELRGEREYSRRLLVAVAELKSAVSVGRAQLQTCYQDGVDGDACKQTPIKWAFDSMDNRVNNANAILCPLASEAA